MLHSQEPQATSQRDTGRQAQGRGRWGARPVCQARPLGFGPQTPAHRPKKQRLVATQNRLPERTWDIWAAVLPLAPTRTMARAEEMLSGERNTFFELSSPSFFRRVKAKVPFASDSASMVASLKGLI